MFFYRATWRLDGEKDLNNSTGTMNVSRDDLAKYNHVSCLDKDSVKLAEISYKADIETLCNSGTFRGGVAM